MKSLLSPSSQVLAGEVFLQVNKPLRFIFPSKGAFKPDLLQLPRVFLSCKISDLETVLIWEYSSNSLLDLLVPKLFSPVFHQ